MNMKQICHFDLDGRNFGICLTDIKEICSLSEIRPVHHSNPIFTGLMNLRGNMILIVDLRKVFGFPSLEKLDSAKILLLKSHLDEGLGFLVDGVQDIVDVDWDQIEDRRKNTTQDVHSERRNSPKLSHGILKTEHELTVMINSAEILDSLNTKEATHA